MDFDLRQWLLILGPLFIAGVLVHGYFRMRAGQNELKMKLDKNFLSEPGDAAGVDDLSLLKAELPNGGARVISQAQPATGASEAPDDTPEPIEPVIADAEEVPVLHESVELPDVGAAEVEATISELEDSIEEPPVTRAPPAMRAEVPDPEPETQAAMSPEADTAMETAPPVSARPEKFVVVNVFALDEPFPGQQLLEVLLEGGMTFGEMDIFHKLDENADPEFSLASAVEPGVFDMSTMDSFSTPGVTLFMRVHELAEPVRVLDEMLTVAESIANELNGEIRDETRSVMTSQTIEHCRQSVREFQFKYSAA